ncbi:MAG: hypothetical protein EXR45_00395 [Chloroflexi bacterium]|nr:hypothetical protein [Chloroflexota bacterium]
MEAGRPIVGLGRFNASAGVSTGHQDGEPIEWRWLVRELRTTGGAQVRASADWQWVTFRRAEQNSEVRQIVRLPEDGQFTVSRYDSRAQTCELLGDFPDAPAALRAALA